MKHAATAALAIALSAYVVVGATQPPEQARPETRGQGRIPPVTGRIVSSSGTVRVIVRLSEGFVPEGQLSAEAALSQRNGIARAEARVLSGPAARHILRSERFQTIPYTVMEVDADGLADLAADRNVLDIQYDRIDRMTLAQSTALVQSTTTTAAGHTGSGYAVAILDTGVQAGHPFLAGRVIHEACYSTTVAGQSTSVCPSGTNPGGQDTQIGSGSAAPCSLSSCDHGTHVAGIAAGANYSGGPGYSGVAPGAGIISMQIFSRFDSEAFCGAGRAPCVLTYGSDQIRGLEAVFALRHTHNIAAVNMSLGGGRFFTQADCDLANGSGKAAIDNLRSAGIATVIASGNDGFTTSMSSPGCISTAISVGSTTDSAAFPQVSLFSNAAPFLSLLAPGSNISASITGSGFGSKNGTSMATPHVAGAFAVLKARFPSATVTEILSALQGTGRSVIDSRPHPTSGFPINMAKPLIQLNDAINSLTPSCTYFINPTSVSVGSGSAQGSIALNTTAGCAWTAVSNDSFITITSAGSGSGAAMVNFTLAANTTTSQRVGTATIGGQTFSVTQSGAEPCTYSINPNTISIGNVTASGNITVTTQPGCAWSATSNNSFITFTNATGRSGSGALPFTVATNSATGSRQGTATIAGQAFTVNQEAAPVLRLAPDINNDGDYDLVWQNRFGGGYLAGWMMNGLNLADSALFNPATINDPNWRVAATADMDGDGKMDLIFQEETQGWIGIWKMNGLNLVTSLAISIERVPPNWKIVAAQDFNNDGKADLVWHDRTEGYIALWYMDGVNVTASELFSPGRVADTNWQIEAAADFNSDGKPDLVWRHQTEGWITVWFMDGITLVSSRALSPSRVSDTNWRIAAIGDVNRDNMPDLIWHDIVNGWIGVWLMSGHALASSIAFNPERVPDVNWRIVGPK